MSTLFRWSGLVIAGTAAILTLVFAIVAMIAPRIDLSNMRPQFEAVAGQALGRALELQGPLSLRLSLPPAIEAAQIRILNPPGWSSPEFARVDKISATVRLSPLLGGQIVVDEVNASGTSISLEATADGRANWRFAAGNQNTGDGKWKLVAVNRLSLRDLVLHFNNQTQQDAVAVHIEALTGKLPADEPIQLKMTGTAQDFPFSVDAAAGSLTELLAPDGTLPVKATMGLNNIQLQLTGSVTKPLELQEIDVNFQLEGNQVADIAAILDVSLPEIGEYQITGGIGGNLDHLVITAVEGHLGKTAFSGDLQLDISDERSNIEGSLVARTLDLGPWLKTEETPAQTSSAEQPVANAIVLPEVDLHLEVGKVLNLPVEVEDASLMLKLRGDMLTAPLQFKIDDVVVRGDIGVERKNGEYRATAALHTRQNDIGYLTERYTDLKGIAGKIGTLSIEASTHGTKLWSFIQNLGVDVQIRDTAMTYGNNPGETPVDIDVDEITFHGPSRQRAHLSFEGRLLGESITTELRLGDLPTILQNRNLPFDLRAAGAGAELTLSGQLSGRESTDDTSLHVQLSGMRFGELAPWLRVSPEADTSFSLTGELNVQSGWESWRLSNFHAQLGRSSIDGAIGRSRLEGQAQLQASLVFDVIDPFELERFFETGQGGGKNEGSGGVGMDLPILPKDLNLEDMDIDIQGQRVILEPSDITDISFSTRIRDGHVAEAPFQGTLAGTTFIGDLALDLRGKTPEIKLEIDALDVDIGNFLRELQLATEIDAHSKRLRAQVIARGSSISELIDDTKIDIEAVSGTWFLADPNQAGGAHIEVLRGTAKATTRNKHTLVKLDARIDSVPMDFTLETRRLQNRTGVDELLDTKIKAVAAGAELTLQGLVPRLRGLRGLDMHMSFHGNRMDSLNELFNVSLPPFGPYSVDGRLRIGDTEYDLSDLAVRFGETVVNGYLKLSTAGAKPHLSSMLEAKTLRLDDFKLGDWSSVAVSDKQLKVVETAVDEKANAKTPAKHDKVKLTKAETAQPLLSREVMRGFDAAAVMRVGEVLSGQDRLGFGDLNIELLNGQLSLSLDVDLPGGEAGLELSLHANEQDYAATLRSKIENFDYGVFARRIKPDTDMAGKFSIDVGLASQAEALSLIDDNANGYFDFAIWPETLRSGVFDLWTANLFFAVLPVLNLQTQSKVNCVVGRLDMKDGVMTPEPLFMDTTRTQVRAKGEINFRTERVKLRFTPRSKRPKFFSLSTPVMVEGRFTDFNVGLRSGDLLGTVIRMLATVILVPGQYITQGVRPGVDTKRCDQAIGVREE